MQSSISNHPFTCRRKISESRWWRFLLIIPVTKSVSFSSFSLLGCFLPICNFGLVEGGLDVCGRDVWRLVGCFSFFAWEECGLLVRVADVCSLEVVDESSVFVASEVEGNVECRPFSTFDALSSWIRDLLASLEAFGCLGIPWVISEAPGGLAFLCIFPCWLAASRFLAIKFTFVLTSFNFLWSSFPCFRVSVSCASSFSLPFDFSPLIPPSISDISNLAWNNYENLALVGIRWSFCRHSKWRNSVRCVLRLTHRLHRRRLSSTSSLFCQILKSVYKTWHERWTSVKGSGLSR